MAEASDNRLRLLVERIERLIEERAVISEDIRAVYAEAKAVGYDAATVRRVIARRATHPADRAEADALLETYEAALGMDEAEPEALHGPGAAALDLATLLLAEQVEALDDPLRAAELAEHVLFLLDLRAEIRELRRQESERKKLAAAEGWDAKALARVVQWFEKVAKHGQAAMQLGEANFRQYRQTIETQRGAAAPGDGAALTVDSKLAALFPAKPAKPNRLNKTLARLAGTAAQARRAMED